MAGVCTTEYISRGLQNRVRGGGKGRGRRREMGMDVGTFRGRGGVGEGLVRCGMVRVDVGG